MRVLKEHRQVFLQTALVVRKQLCWLKQKKPSRVGWESDLEGACAVASVLLFRRLRALNFPARLVLNRDASHVYVTVESVIVDPTASQFGDSYAPVVIGTHRELLRQYGSDAKYFWAAGDKYAEEQDLDYAIKDWATNQQPSSLCSLGLLLD